MNQETQQNVTVSEKPRMYLSWKTTISSTAIVLFSLWLLSSLYISLIDTSQGEFFSFIDNAVFVFIFLIIPVSIIVIPLIFINIIVSVFKKPKGYTQTRYVDIIFISLIPLMLLLLVFASFASTCWYGFCKESSLHLITEYIEIIIPMTVALFVVIMYGTYRNHKFQKSEIELGITQQ